MRVGEFAKRAGVNVETVRYYHREGLLPIPETEGTYRNYTSAHIQKLSFIHKAKLAGFTLDDIKQLEQLDALSDKNEIRRMSEEKMRLLENRIFELESARQFLSGLVKACRQSNNKPCPILQTLKNV